MLTVLMLRGAQTPGELRQRTERMHHFGDGAEVQAALDGLAERELIARLERRPGQKEERYAHRLGEDAPAATLPASEVPTAPAPAPAPRPAPDPGRLDRIEAEVAQLRDEVARLRAALGG